MIPFLGIDTTVDKDNEKFNGEEFIVAKPSSAMSDTLEKSGDQALNVIEESKLPLPIRIAKWICGAVGGLIVIGILKALPGEDGVSLGQAYQNAAWLFWLGGSCLIAWLLLHILSIKKEKHVLESEENSHLFSRLDQIADSIYDELKVPADAQTVDILSFSYKMKDGAPVVREKLSETTPYINFEHKIFADAENLYLADLEGKYSFPLSSFSAIRRVKKGIILPVWNKDIDPDKGIYKPYKLSVNDFGVHCKPYYIVELERDGSLWGIYIPCYELPVFEQLTGLKAQTE